MQTAESAPKLPSLKKIESYGFGNIVINGQKYTSDVIIYKTHVDSSWWRKKGHELNIEDIGEIIKAKPKVLVVGKGAFGILKVLKETKEFIEGQGIKLVAENTKKATEIYNKLLETKEDVIAALHLTC